MIWVVVPENGCARLDVKDTLNIRFLCERLKMCRVVPEKGCALLHLWDAVKMCSLCVKD